MSVIKTLPGMLRDCENFSSPPCPNRQEMQNSDLSSMVSLSDASHAVLIQSHAIATTFNLVCFCRNLAAAIEPLKDRLFIAAK
mmetsp:Transcript_39308/g.61269  ORF Transcript_39308/g.61269 Transcript_39308/m.61269 type:complete len:83 (+) Transcript_39308:1034-1282(+)